MNTCVCVCSVYESCKAKKRALRRLHHWGGILPPRSSISQHDVTFRFFFYPDWEMLGVAKQVSFFSPAFSGEKAHFKCRGLFTAAWSPACLLLSAQERQSASVWYRVQLKPSMASTTLSQRKSARCLRAPRNLSQSAYCSRRPPSTLTASNRWDAVHSLPGHAFLHQLAIKGTRGYSCRHRLPSGGEISYFLWQSWALWWEEERLYCSLPPGDVVGWTLRSFKIVFIYSLAMGSVRKLWVYVVIYTCRLSNETGPCGSCSLNPWD